ncbi:MAG: flagellar basal body L-ring protein FlgH [Salinisphaeraceae bacterium]|mgnify:CR=1 FL=1
MTTRLYRRGIALIGLAALSAGCATAPPEKPPGVIAPPPAAASTPGAIYQAGQGLSLFQDRRARQVGDTVTVLLAEKTSAQKAAATTTSKEGGISLANPTLFGREVMDDGRPLLNASVDGSRSFDGSGASSQSNQLDGRITVTVTEVLGNGNLVVAGEKWLTINQGREYIRLAGVIRPDDVLPDNTVPSARVAQAQISYSGKGALADSNSQGWLLRVFNSPWFPF